MPNKKSPFQLFSKAYNFFVSGQFSKLASKTAFYLRNEKRLMERRKRLRAHGLTVLEQVMGICRQTGTRPHLTFCTLLGYRRDNALISGDGDLDFALLSAD